MTPSPFANALVLTGPTGCGKTARAVELARQVNAEIVSMDSMALYRGMDVGTAKPTMAERGGVPHYLLSVLEPWESASVAWWLEEAARCVEDIEARGKTALIVGGTAFYLKAMLFGLFEGPGADPDVRARLTREAEELGGGALHRRLAGVDPEAAARLHPNDVRRVVRALEVWELTGRPLSHWQQQWTGEPAPGPACVWIDLPRGDLYARINARVERMIKKGLVDEVRGLLQLPRPLSREASQALGYKEVIEHLQGRVTLAEAVATVQTRTRQFAKRQVTWFRHLPGCTPARGELTLGLWRRRMK